MVLNTGPLDWESSVLTTRPLLYCKCDQALICSNSLNWLLNSNLIYETQDWGKKWLVDFNAGKTRLVSLYQSNNTGSFDVKMDGSVLEENQFLRC